MKMSQNNAVKLLSFKAMCMNALYVPFIMFLNQYHEQLLILCFFICVDFVIGFFRSLYFGHRIEFRRFWGGVMTKFMTMLLPFLLYYFSRGVRGFGDDLALILPYGFSALIVAEAYSVLGHFYAFKTGKELEDKDLLSFVILNIRKFFEAWIEAFRFKR